MTALDWLLDKHLNVFVLILSRVSALLISMPVMGTKLVQKKIKIILSLSITILLFFQLNEAPGFSLLSFTMLFAVAKELVIGLSLGFAFQVCFQLFEFIGEMISMQMGLGFALMVEPLHSHQSNVLSQLFLMLSTLIFLSMDGHLLLIETLAESFAHLPFNRGLERMHFLLICELMQWVIIYGFKLALPICLNLLIAMLALGVMNKSVPQMNVFSIGMSAGVLMGIFLILLSLKNYTNQLNQYFNAVFHLILPGYYRV